VRLANLPATGHCPWRRVVFGANAGLLSRWFCHIEAARVSRRAYSALVVADAERIVIEVASELPPRGVAETPPVTWDATQRCPPQRFAGTNVRNWRRLSMPLALAFPSSVQDAVPRARGWSTVGPRLAGLSGMRACFERAFHTALP
jgi:hypothetical protein